MHSYVFGWFQNSCSTNVCKSNKYFQQFRVIGGRNNSTSFIIWLRNRISPKYGGFCNFFGHILQTNSGSTFRKQITQHSWLSFTSTSLSSQFVVDNCQSVTDKEKTRKKSVKNSFHHHHCAQSSKFAYKKPFFSKTSSRRRSCSIFCLICESQAWSSSMSCSVMVKSLKTTCHRIIFNGGSERRLGPG